MDKHPTRAHNNRTSAAASFLLFSRVRTRTSRPAKAGRCYVSGVCVRGCTGAVGVTGGARNGFFVHGGIFLTRRGERHVRSPLALFFFLVGPLCAGVEAPAPACVPNLSRTLSKALSIIILPSAQKYNQKRHTTPTQGGGRRRWLLRQLPLPLACRRRRRRRHAVVFFR